MKKHDVRVRRPSLRPVWRHDVLFMVIAVYLQTACSEPPDQSNDRRQPAGAQLVEVPALASESTVWTSERVYSTLGVDTLQLGSGESFFARFLSDGSLAVANGASIITLSSDGRFERVLARKGSGPGEFQVIMALGVSDDGSLFASDHLSGRLTRLSSQGEVLHTTNRLRPFSENAQVAPFAVLPDGRTLAVPWQWQAAREASPDLPTGTLVRDRVSIVVYDDKGEVRDTVADLPGLERSGGFVAAFPRSVLYAGRGGSHWAAGLSDSLDLTVYQGTTPRMRVVAPMASVPLTNRQRAQRDSAVVAKFGRDVGQAVLARQSSSSDRVTAPDIGGIVLDAAQRIWVGMRVLPGEPERKWLILSDRGERIGQLMLPAFGDALLPSRTELLDAADGRVALARETPEGETYIEVRRVVEK